METLEKTSTEASIDRVVNASLTQNEKPAAAIKNPPPKRAGGRPKAGGAPNKATVAKMKAALGSDVPPVGPTDSAEVPKLPPIEVPAMEVPIEALTSVLKMPFNLLRARTKFPGFKLDDATARECAPLLNQMINQYLPNIDPVHAPAIMLAATLCTILFSQATAYSEWVAAQVPASPPETPAYRDPVYARSM
jgi:hypothetical protein